MGEELNLSERILANLKESRDKPTPSEFTLSLDDLTPDEFELIEYWNNHPSLEQELVTRHNHNRKVGDKQLSSGHNRKKLHEFITHPEIGLEAAKKYIDRYFECCEKGWHLLVIDGKKQCRTYHSLFGLVFKTLVCIKNGGKDPPWFISPKTEKHYKVLTEQTLEAKQSVEQEDDHIAEPRERQHTMAERLEDQRHEKIEQKFQEQVEENKVRVSKPQTTGQEVGSWEKPPEERLSREERQSVTDYEAALEELAPQSEDTSPTRARNIKPDVPLAREQKVAEYQNIVDEDLTEGQRELRKRLQETRKNAV